MWGYSYVCGFLRAVMAMSDYGSCSYWKALDAIFESAYCNVRESRECDRGECDEEVSVGEE